MSFREETLLIPEMLSFGSLRFSQVGPFPALVCDNLRCASIQEPSDFRIVIIMQTHRECNIIRSASAAVAVNRK